MTAEISGPDNGPRATARIVGVIAVGGVIGALARHGLSTAWPSPEFPWATFVVNASGCFALGVLMAWVLGRQGVHPLLRPFLGTGVLGGYTTFSTYAVEVDGLLRDGHGLVALAYLAGSVVVGLAAAWVGFAVVGRRHLATPTSLGADTTGEAERGGIE